MKIPFAILFAVLLSGCSVFAPGNLGPGAASRDQLWRQGHAALHADSFRVAMAAFQRLAAEHPRDPQGREARFYLGTLYLDPGNPAYDAAQAEQNFSVYLATDTAGGRMGGAGFRWHSRHQPMLSGSACATTAIWSMRPWQLAQPTPAAKWTLWLKKA